MEAVAVRDYVHALIECINKHILDGILQAHKKKAKNFFFDNATLDYEKDARQ